MDRIDTISELLLCSGSQYRVYDIGRKISKISKEDFNRIEHNHLPYPYPIQGHAIFAIAFWQVKSKSPYLWFIKLPLDERGLLNQGARNHFIAIIVEALGSDLTVDPTEKQQQLLNSNPYHVQPAEYKLACINSLIRKELKQSHSIHFEHFQAYINGKLAWDDWQNIGIQGINDIACEITNADISHAVSSHISNFPEAVLFPLCQALEHQALPLNVIEALISLEKSSQNTALTTHVIRAFSSSAEHPHVQDFINNLLSSPQTEDIYITVVGRCWQAISKEGLEQLLSVLAEQKDLSLFSAIFKDLVAIPSLRPHVFSLMRSETRSESLAKAIGLLFK